MAKVNWEGQQNTEPVQLPQQIEQTEQEPLYRSSFSSGGGVVVPTKEFRSSNFKGGDTGWILQRNGFAEMNGNVQISTNFTKVASFKGVSVYVSDGTTPNGNLSGTAGDICYNGPSGQPFYCAGTTTWTGM